jgi:hypothetical protein
MVKIQCDDKVGRVIFVCSEIFLGFAEFANNYITQVVATAKRIRSAFF